MGLKDVKCRLLALLVMAAVTTSGAAQTAAPSLSLVVPFPAGGVTDLAARALAERLGPLLERTVVVENRPGGGSRIGVDVALNEALASAPLRQRLVEMGLSAEGGDATRMLRQIREDVRLHRAIAERSRLRFE